MSLLVWLPLNGSINNQGVGDLTCTTSGPLYKSAGKLGESCLNLNKRVSFTCPQLANLQSFSVCFWGMSEASSTLTTDWQDLIGFIDVSSSGSSGNFRWETCYAYNAPGIHWHDNVVYALASDSNGSSTHTTQRGVWCHCCVVFDNENKTVSTYSNGKLISINKHTGGKFNSTGSFYLGETNNIEGRIQDVRFYDHCLSTREIKEISKGMVLHYPLNQQERLVNLIPNSYINETSASYGFAGRGASLTAGKTYTLFVNGRVIDGDGRLETYIYNTDWTESTNNGTKSNVDVTYRLVFTPKTTGIYSITSYSLVSQGVPGGNVHLNWYKLVEGNVTSMLNWSPAPSDASSWGFTEYDTSGNRNNGVITQSTIPIYNDSSPRYGGCYTFDTTAKYITVPLGTTGFKDSYTISYWAKIANMNGSMAWGFGNGNRLNIFPADGVFHLNTGDGYENPIKNGDTSVSFSPYNNAWHHYALTGDGTTANLYIDGSLVGTALKYRSITGTQLYISGWNTNSEYKWSGGQISDFRIYATALSATDIKELYNAPFAVSNNGVLLIQGEVQES